MGPSVDITMVAAMTLSMQRSTRERPDAMTLALVCAQLASNLEIYWNAAAQNTERDSETGTPGILGSFVEHRAPSNNSGTMVGTPVAEKMRSQRGALLLLARSDIGVACPPTLGK